MLLKCRLDEALRLMLEDSNDDHSVKQIVKRCGFGGQSQFSRASHARFGVPRHSTARWSASRTSLGTKRQLMADGFDQDSLLWRQK